MRRVHPIPRRLTGFLACLVVTLLVSGCDAEGDPLAVIVAEETRGALALDMGVPALPDLVRESGTEERLGPALEGWTASWGWPDGQGRDVRRDAYDEAVPVLADALGRDRIEQELERLGRAVDAARGLPDASLPSTFRERIVQAAGLEQEGRAALAADRTVDALHSAVAGSDLLREIGPRNVALYLVDRATEALERVRSEGVGGSERDARRGSRMVLGAQEALESRDYPLAIRRAYYACHLLGVEIDL